MSKQATITLETAKDMYKSNIQSLVKLALDNFSKEELESIDYPKRWEDLKKTEGYYVDSFSCIVHTVRGTNINTKNIFPKESTANAVIALAQLLQLREVFVKDWVADYTDGKQNKFVIISFDNFLSKEIKCKCNAILSFPTSELRDKFFDLYEDLLEEAKELL